MVNGGDGKSEGKGKGGECRNNKHTEHLPQDDAQVKHFLPHLTWMASLLKEALPCPFQRWGNRGMPLAPHPRTSGAGGAGCCSASSP